EPQGVGRQEYPKAIIALRVVIGGVALAWLRPEARRTHAVRKAEQYIGQVRANVETARTLSAHLAIIDDYAPTVFLNTIFKIVAPTMIPGLLSQGIVDRWLNKWLGVERGTMRRLLRGIPGNPTTEMDLQLWAAAQVIAANAEAKGYMLGQSVEVVADAYQRGTLPTAAQQAIKAFLDSYGMRAVAEIDVGRPRWREDPRSIIQTLCSFLQIEDPDLAPDK